MDIIILIGVFIFMLGILITVFNTKIRYGFIFTHYEYRNRSMYWLSVILIILGLIIITIKAYLNGQFN